MPPLFGTEAHVRRPRGLSRALAAFGGAPFGAPLTDLSAGAFRQPFQTMAARWRWRSFSEAALFLTDHLRWRRRLRHAGDNQLKHFLFGRLGDQPVADIAAAFQNHDAVANLENVGHAMRNDDLRHIVAFQL